MDFPESFPEKVLAFVKSVPRGKVVSYGQIAAHLGTRDARIVGWIMHSLGAAPDFPWWRVLNNEGKITIKDPAGRQRQKDLLVAEGIEVNDDFALDMKKYRHGVPARQQEFF